MSPRSASVKGKPKLVATQRAQLASHGVELSPCHVLFAHFPFEAWGTNTFSFHKTPRNLCFDTLRCGQNLAVLTICNEQVSLQWAHIPRECCPGCSSTWVGQCACVFLSGSRGTDLYWPCVANQGRYILIQNGLRGQLGIDHTPDCMTKASLWHSGVCMGLCCLSLWENLTSLL